MQDLIFTFFISMYSPYYQVGLVCAILLIITLISKFSEGALIESGIYVFSGWMFGSFCLSFFTETYWSYVLHWLAASMLFFAYWFLSIFLTERFGRPYNGDGAMAILIPIYFVPITLIASIAIKSIIVFIHSF